MTYRVADPEDIPRYNNAPLEGPHMKLVRRAFGIRSFGITQTTLGPNWDDYPEHDETETNHEELYLCLDGGGTMTVDGEEVEMKPGRYILVTPESRRRIRSGEQGLSYLVMGAPADRDYGGWPDF